MSIELNRVRARSVQAVALVVLAFAAVAMFASSNANAAFTAPYNVKCTGSDIAGRGASFLNAAMNAFIPYWKTNTGASSTSGCGPASPTNITYDPAGSGAGRNAFGQGAFDRDPAIRFIGTDEAPTATQRSQMEAAQGTTGQGKLAVNPVTIGANTIVVHFPRYCELPAGDPDLAAYARFKVSNARLAAAWFGDANNDEWGELLPGIKAVPNNPAGRTNQQCQDYPITRVVRFDSSGTTFGFKQFLHAVAPSAGWSTTYTQLNWPNPANVVNGGAAGNGPLVDKVKATQGSIGYTDLATARDKGMKKLADNPASLDPGQYKNDDGNAFSGFPTYGWTFSFNKRLFWIPLERANAGGPTGSGLYSEPTNDPISIRNNRKGANCGSVTVTGAPGPSGGFAHDPYGDWSATSANLSINRYPICTLSYVGFWDDYADVYGNTAAEQAKARTVKDLLTTSFYTGQNLMYGADYATLPSAIRTNGQLAINTMNWNKP